jgi:hypothetical protein
MDAFWKEATVKVLNIHGVLLISSSAVATVASGLSAI